MARQQIEDICEPAWTYTIPWTVTQHRGTKVAQETAQHSRELKGNTDYVNVLQDDLRRELKITTAARDI